MAPLGNHGAADQTGGRQICPAGTDVLKRLYCAGVRLTTLFHGNRHLPGILFLVYWQNSPLLVWRWLALEALITLLATSSSPSRRSNSLAWHRAQTWYSVRGSIGRLCAAVGGDQNMECTALYETMAGSAFCWPMLVGIEAEFCPADVVFFTAL